MDKECARCGHNKPEHACQNFDKCGAYYCDQRCASKHWPIHYPVCSSFKQIGHKPGDSFGPKTLGYVVTVGNFTMVRMLELNDDAVFQIAKAYVNDNKLGWSVRKPHAWADYQTGPHVTLSPAMKQYNGEFIEVELGSLFHFDESPSHWVAFHVKLPSKFQCPYGCHISIAQQRFK